MLIAEQFISSLMNRYSRHPLSADGITWYPQTYKLRIKNHPIHSSFEKSLIERTRHYMKYRMDGLMAIFLAEERSVN